jgi:D-tyrosyl-tRNA(Tyr) deacylase
VSQASVTVDGEVVGAIDGPGLVVLLGVTHDDTEEKAKALAAKIWTLRILRDLYADTRKGRRPSWSAAAPGPVSEPLYDAFCAALEGLGAKVERGRFGAHMDVALVNDGPVTLILDA